MLKKPKFQEVKALVKKSLLLWLATGFLFGLLIWIAQNFYADFFSQYAFYNDGGLLLLSGIAGGLMVFVALRRIDEATHFSILSIAAGILIGFLATIVCTMVASVLWTAVGIIFGS